MKVTVNLEGLHRLSSFHRRAVLAAPRVGCFCCLRIFKPSEIKSGCDHRAKSIYASKSATKEWKTACCPYCMVDSILPDRTFGFRLTKKLLVAMEARWFGRSIRRADGRSAG